MKRVSRLANADTNIAPGSTELWRPAGLFRRFSAGRAIIEQLIGDVLRWDAFGLLSVLEVLLFDLCRSMEPDDGRNERVGEFSTGEKGFTCAG